MENFFLSEWKLDTSVQQIPLFIYTIPQRYMEQSEIEKDTGDLYYKLRDLNGNSIMHFAGNKIASLKPIKHWENHSYRKEEKRPIQLEHSQERRLLERILMQDCLSCQPKKSVFTVGNKIILKQPKVFRSVEVRRYIQIDFQVRSTGEILFGYDLGHKYNLNQTLFDLLNRNPSRVYQGMELFDITTGKVYIFVDVLDKTISDPILNGESLIEYQINRNRDRYIKNIPPKTFAVRCLGKNGEPLSFIPQLLRPVSRFENVPPEGQRYSKIPAHDRVGVMINWAKGVLNYWVNGSTLPIRVTYGGAKISSLGYKKVEFPKPMFRFGKDRVHQDFFKGLRQYQVHTPVDYAVKCHMMIDQEIRHIIPDEKQIFNMLKRESVKLGVPLEQIETHIISMTNTTEVRLGLKDIAEKMQPDHLVIFVTNNDLNDDFYRVTKQELGKEHQINSQVIKIGTLEKEQGQMYTLMNILLGIYCKSGIQPWVLKEPLHSDCFIGLDVSHENKKHTTGVVQVIGKSGETLWSKPMTSSESGEKIDARNLEMIIVNSVSRYRRKYEENPPHITFHRDGKGHDYEIQVIQKIMGELGIQYDYVSIAKNISRRMAWKDQGRWNNPEGIAFLREKENVAYLCSTNPHWKMGMAQPIRIWNRTNNMELNKIVEDIYRLSFMNVHAINKSRLPVTVNYADKSSTFYGRGMLPLEKELTLPFV